MSTHRTAPVSIDDRGSVTTEYAVLLGFVAVGCALAVVTLGAPLVQTFLA
jgi:Flp pilus assembly pilin Flp